MLTTPYDPCNGSQNMIVALYIFDGIFFHSCKIIARLDEEKKKKKLCIVYNIHIAYERLTRYLWVKWLDSFV